MADWNDGAQHVRSGGSSEDFQGGSSPWRGARAEEQARSEAWAHAMFGSPKPASSGSSSEGGGFIITPIMVEFGAVVYFTATFLYPHVAEFVIQFTPSDNWKNIVNVGLALAVGGLYVWLQFLLLSNRYLGALTRYALSLLWGYLVYQWAFPTSTFSLACWATAGAAIAYGEKRLIVSLAGGDSEEVFELGWLFLIEIPLVNLACIYRLLAEGTPALPAIALGLAVGFAYSALTRAIARTFLVYPLTALLLLAWMAGAFWLSQNALQASVQWQLGILSMTGIIAWFDKRVAIDRYRAVRKTEELSGTRTPVFASAPTRDVETSQMPDARVAQTAAAAISSSEPDERTVVKCPRCMQNIRLPSGRHGQARCPACGNQSFFAT